VNRALKMLAGAFVLAWAAGAPGQEPKPPVKPPTQQPPLLRPTPRLAPGHPPVDAVAQRRRLQEVDRLLAAGNLSRAESLINELSGHSWLERDLLPRRIRLASLKGEHAEAADLCREALGRQPRNANLWRELTAALLADGQPGDARAAADSFVVHAPDRQSATVVVVDLFDPEQRPRMTVALIDSMRLQLGDARLLTRQRAVGLLLGDRQKEAAAELSAELRFNAYNLALVRTEILDGPYRPADHVEFLAELQRLARERAAHPAEMVLVADLLLAGGRADEAVAAVQPLLTAPVGQRHLLQNASALARELRLVDDPVHNAAAARYMLAVLGELSGPQNRDRNLRRRAAQLLAEVGLTSLDEGWLADDPRDAAARMGDLLDVVRELDPASPDLHAGRIRLAIFTRDRLGDARAAAASLESMLLNLDLPLEGVAVVRLTLGETYLAAADTSRARAVLTSLGRDPDFREAGGHAHFHLARLDLAQLNFVTARDRFAVVALDNPGAPYANDALDLGLAVAEELDNPSGGPTLLARYAASVYWDLVGEAGRRAEALRDFIDVAAAMADPTEPQRLLERGLWELAELEKAVGRSDAALDLYGRIVADHPGGRYPASALLASARLLTAAGRDDDSREALQRLLAQYPDWLFADDARDALRSLP
jgi:tetratricopeptide (TPR) repeat protein